ncbi:hypothetical protein [uncultured Propionivibrio sp.]|uniref:hypothetical protein n=1 Tax=uncultured Propionivibrio sp. TaxID=426737 RepID=UPI0029C06A35|nr:hypothetical protein [uncultured Propionivibrio sp.]
MKAELRCGKFVGETFAWLDGPDVEGFLAEFEVVADQLKGTATLQSDDGFSLVLRLGPTDSLGLSCLKQSSASEHSYSPSSTKLSYQALLRLMQVPWPACMRLR